MKLDSLNLAAIVTELGPLLKDAAPQKISQLSEEDYLFVFRRPGQTLRLLISLRPEESRLHLLEQPTPPAQSPSAFTMLLRKHLEGRRLGRVAQVGLERTVELDFPVYQEKPALKLVLHIPGRDNTLMLLNESGKVLGAHGKRGQPEASYLPRADSLTGQQLLELLDHSQPLQRALPKAVFGLPPFYARQIVVEAGQDPGAPPIDPEALERAWDGFWADFRAGRFQPAVTDHGELSFRGQGLPYPTMQQAAEAAWAGASRAPGLEQLRSEALRKVQKALTRVEKRLGELGRDLGQTEKAELYQHWGQLLLSRLEQVPLRATTVSLIDFDEACRVEIALNARLTPSENAQKLFRRSRKLKRAGPLIAAQVEKATAERDYLLELQLAIAQAGSAGELSELEPRPVERRARPEKPRSGPRRYVLDGFELWVGRNPAQNDRLTHKLAARDDLWFHARNLPGAHVILRAAGRTPSQEAVLAAAVLAARHSQASDSSKVEVDFTLVRYVKKPSGSPPGKVIYHHETSLVVDPCQALSDLRELSS
ncbi:fibronectin-binding domain-containing protein [bacterium CPR1]|nr:fibronectin-binding domain-containing protein [bacterium CPR1]